MVLALLEPATSVVKKPWPLPPEAPMALAPLAVLLLAILVLYAIRRRRVRRDGRRRGGVMASFALSVALGNALVELSSVCDPTRPAVMAMESGDRAPVRRGDGRDPSRPP